MDNNEKRKRIYEYREKLEKKYPNFTLDILTEETPYHNWNIVLYENYGIYRGTYTFYKNQLKKTFDKIEYDIKKINENSDKIY